MSNNSSYDTAKKFCFQIHQKVMMQFINHNLSFRCSLYMMGLALEILIA